MFKVEVESVQTVLNTQGQGQALRPLHRPPQQRQEGVRVPEAGPGNQLRRGGRVIMALVKVKPTSPGRRAHGQGRATGPAQGRPVRAAARAADRRTPAATTTATSPPATRAVATSTTTASSTSCATRTASRRRSSASSTTRTAARTSRCCCYADGERRYIIAPQGLDGRRDS